MPAVISYQHVFMGLLSMLLDSPSGHFRSLPFTIDSLQDSSGLPSGLISHWSRTHPLFISNHWTNGNPYGRAFDGLPDAYGPWNLSDAMRCSGCQANASGWPESNRNRTVTGQLPKKCSQDRPRNGSQVMTHQEMLASNAWKTEQLRKKCLLSDDPLLPKKWSPACLKCWLDKPESKPEIQVMHSKWWPDMLESKPESKPEGHSLIYKWVHSVRLHRYSPINIWG